MCHAMHTFLAILAVWFLIALAVAVPVGLLARAGRDTRECPTCHHTWALHWDQVGCFAHGTCTCRQPVPSGARPPRRARRGRWI